MVKNKMANVQMPARTIEETVRHVFPGPGNARAPQRVHFFRRAYAGLTAHAKEPQQNAGAANTTGALNKQSFL